MQTVDIFLPLKIARVYDNIRRFFYSIMAPYAGQDEFKRRLYDIYVILDRKLK